MSEGWAAALAQVPALGAQQLLLSAAALALGLAIALPLGVMAARHSRLRGVALGAASLIQTIPALALLALFYPALLGLSSLVGGGVPALGFVPSLLALALYALLPILRTVVAGIGSIDPALREAADALGMSARQRLWLVEAPLAAPVVMAGIRTATVWTIGAATLATTVGQPTLGNLIFAGLQTETWTLVLVGCAASAAIAILADALLGMAERGAATGRRILMLVPGAIVALALAAAGVIAAPRGQAEIVVGAKNFSEQYILARLIGDRLSAAGYAVRYREGLGSAVALAALEAGDVDVYVDYSGTIWTNAMRRDDSPPRAAMIAAIDRWLRGRAGATVAGPLGFENAYALAMRRSAAREAGIASIADLTAVAPRLVLGADLEFLDRPEWARLRAAYRLRFGATRSFSPTFMYRALQSGQADIISAFSSDGRMAAQDLVILSDPRRAIPAYDALMLVSPRHARDVRFLKALAPLVNAITPDRMRKANYMVDREQDKASPAAAAAWLARR